MTNEQRERLVRLAREAGFSTRYDIDIEIHGDGHETDDISSKLSRFAALVAEEVASMPPAAWMSPHGSPMDHETFIAWRDAPGAPRMPGAALPETYRPLVSVDAIRAAFKEPKPTE